MKSVKTDILHESRDACRLKNDEIQKKVLSPNYVMNWTLIALLKDEPLLNN